MTLRMPSRPALPRFATGEPTTPHRRLPAGNTCLLLPQARHRTAHE